MSQIWSVVAEASWTSKFVGSCGKLWSLSPVGSRGGGSLKSQVWSVGTEFLSFHLPKIKENSEAQNLQNFYAILCNPWISSAMAMAMSIYRTLCVLVFLKISLLEMLIAFGNEHLDFFNFSPFFFFFPENFTSRDAHCFWQ